MNALESALNRFCNSFRARSHRVGVVMDDAVLARHRMPLMRPTDRKTITGTENPIADCLISDASFCGHSGQNRHAHVDIVVDDHLALGVVEAGIWGHPDEER